MPLFSVIIPARDASSTIKNCLASCAGQDNVEVIVVNDHSTDRTDQIVGNFEVPVRLIHSDRFGVSAARNTGATASRGEFLVFLDADDFLLPSWSESFADLTKSSPVFVSCAAEKRDLQDGSTSIVKPTNRGPVYRSVVANFLAGTYAIRRDVFFALGGFDEALAYSENSELGLRLSEHCYKSKVSPACTEEVLVVINYDRGPDRVRSYHDARLKATLRIVDKHGGSLARDESMLADYHRVAGFSAASQGNFACARKHYLLAARFAKGRKRLGDGLRAATTAVRVLRRIAW